MMRSIKITEGYGGFAKNVILPNSGYFKFDNKNPNGFRGASPVEFVNDLNKGVTLQGTIMRDFSGSGDLAVSDGVATQILKVTKHGEILTSDLSLPIKMKWAPPADLSVEEIAADLTIVPLNINIAVSVLDTRDRIGSFSLERGVQNGSTKIIRLHTDALYGATVQTSPTGSFALTLSRPFIKLIYDATDPTNPFWRITMGATNAFVSSIIPGDHIINNPQTAIEGSSIALAPNGKHLFISALTTSGISSIAEITYNGISWGTPNVYLSPFDPILGNAWGQSLTTDDALDLFVGAVEITNCGGSIWLGTRTTTTDRFTEPFINICSYQLDINARLGESLAVRSGVLVAGASGQSWPSGSSGTIVIAEKNNNWIFNLPIEPTSTINIQRFGYSVATAGGNIIVVGAPSSIIGGEIRGEVVVYGRKTRTSTWRALRYVVTDNINHPFIVDSAVTNAPSIGHCVDVSADGTTIIIGAPNYNNNEGAVIITYLKNDIWEIKTVLYGSGQFGESIKISADGNTISVGAPYFGDGAVYQYLNIADNWVLQKVIVGQPEHSSLGSILAMSDSGNILVSGAPSAPRPGGLGNNFIIR